MDRSTARGALLALLALALLLTPGRLFADDGPAAPAAEKKEGEAPPALRRPLLWMIEGPTRAYLYGTIHVDDPRVITHLPVVQQALDQATALYTELRLDAEGQQAMQMAVMARAQLPEGTTLKGLLGDELYARVGRAMPPSLPLAVFATMKPWLINFLLQQTLLEQHAEYTRRKAQGTQSGPTSGAPAQPLDMKLFTDAQMGGKQVGGLETIDTQLDVFDRLEFSTQVMIVEKSVEEIERIRALAEKGEEDDTVPALTGMIRMWLAGDDAGFLKLFEEDLKAEAAKEDADPVLIEESRKIIKGLIDDRNVGMAAKIQELMKADPKEVYVFAVGAGHMPGENGVVKLLEKAGLTVRRIELGATLPACPAQEAPKKEPAGTGAGR